MFYPNQIAIEKYYAKQIENDNPNELYSILGLPIQSSQSEVTKRYNSLMNAVNSRRGINLNDENTEKTLEMIQNNRERINDAYTILTNWLIKYDMIFIADESIKINYFDKTENSEETTYKLYLSNGGYFFTSINKRNGLALTDIKSGHISYSVHLFDSSSNSEDSLINSYVAFNG